MEGELNGQIDSLKLNLILCTDFKNLTIKLGKFHVTNIGYVK